MGTSKVLQLGWLDENLREMDVFQWVKENVERVGNIRDKVMLSQVLVSEERKERSDKRSAVRKLQPRHKVFLRAPSLDSKLTDVHI